MTTSYAPTMGDRITELLVTWKLTAAATELVKRLVLGGHDDALIIVHEVFELEAQTRSERRVPAPSSFETAIVKELRHARPIARTEARPA